MVLMRPRIRPVFRERRENQLFNGGLRQSGKTLSRHYYLRFFRKSPFEYKTAKSKRKAAEGNGAIREDILVVFHEKKSDRLKL